MVTSWRRLILGIWFALAACGDNEHRVYLIDGGPEPQLDASTLNRPCDPLAPTCGGGEKCSWILDSTMPAYAGHVACAPEGTASVGEPCTFKTPTDGGYDNCKRGLVCSDARGRVGTCKPICDLQGGASACDAQRECVFSPGQFTSSTTVGECDTKCDPLADNDFDGAGPLTRASGCGSDLAIGCYGYPSYGGPRQTYWACSQDIHLGVSPPVGLRHRAYAPGPQLYVNSCNQGYEPLLYEQSGSTAVVCIAMCKPLNCFAGHCGTNDNDRFGAAPHRCNSTDAVGAFNPAANGDQCQFLWWREVDDAGKFLPSPTSDTVGFCVDMSKYRYDSNQDGHVDFSDQTLPPCTQLQDGTGSGANPGDPLTYFGAADLGCVDSTHYKAPFSGKPQASRGAAPLGFRGLYSEPMLGPVTR